MNNIEDNSIGGYFSWELPLGCGHFPNDGGMLVNSGHGALEMINDSLGDMWKVLIPYYTCDIVPCTLRRCGVEYRFYHINRDLELETLPDLAVGEYLIYTNYFGIKDRHVAELAEQYGGKLIVDNAQALFAKPIDGCHTIYSPRKFVGVADGGMAFSPMMDKSRKLPLSTSYSIASHLLKRLDGRVTEGYADFKADDTALRNEPCKWMSQMTERHLRSLDYESIKQIRKDNFMYLHERLKDSNKLPLMKTVDITAFECPMVYPYYTDDPSLRKKLIDRRIFVAQYWPNVLDWCKPGDEEYALCQHLLPLPIDQRYGKEDMERIVKLIKNG